MTDTDSSEMSSVPSDTDSNADNEMNTIKAETGDSSNSLANEKESLSTDSIPFSSLFKTRLLSNLSGIAVSIIPNFLVILLFAELCRDYQKKAAQNLQPNGPDGKYVWLSPFNENAPEYAYYGYLLVFTSFLFISMTLIIGVSFDCFKKFFVKPFALPLFTLFVIFVQHLVFSLTTSWPSFYALILFLSVIPALKLIRDVIYKHFDEILPDDVEPIRIPKFITVVFLGNIPLIIIRLVYSRFFVPQFLEISDPLVKFLLRFFLHPILVELALAPERWAILWLHKHSIRKGFRFHPGLLLIIIQFYFSFLGRWLVASMPSFGIQIATAFLLALQDQGLRSTIVHRDKFYFSLLPKKCSNLVELTQTPQVDLVYGFWMAWDEIGETIAVVLSPMCILLFQFSTSKNAPVQDIWGLVGLTLLSLLFEVGSDLGRLFYYFKIAKLEAITASSSLIQRTRSNIIVFWQNLEIIVHTGWTNRHSYWNLLLIVSTVIATSMVIVNFFVTASARYDPKTDELVFYH